MRNIREVKNTNPIHDFAPLLLFWYEKNKRNLPWRENKDPYFIWISEIILQQTRVNQGVRYFEKITHTYNNIYELAEAPLDNLLKLWQGLGYYSRARNLHACANQILKDHGGEFPNSYKELLQLKGIGKYTAAAIASICFDEPVAVVDGNVFRVLSRVFAIEDDISIAKNYSVFANLANELMQNHDPGTFNQSMMELGALVCSPKNPDCLQCPLLSICQGKKLGITDALPVKSKKVKIKERQFNYCVISYNNELLIKQRSSNDIWSGLYEFILFEKENPKNFNSFDDQRNSLDINILGNKISDTYVHQLTHQKLHIKFFVYELRDLDSFLRLATEFKALKVNKKDIEKYAVPKPIELFLKSFNHLK